MFKKKQQVLILVSGRQLFGQEKALITVGITIRNSGADVRFLVHSTWGTEIAKFLEANNFQYTRIPLGTLWSATLILASPKILILNLRSIFLSSKSLKQLIKDTKTTDIIIGNTTHSSYFLPALWFSDLNVIYRHGDEPAGHSLFHRCLNKLLFARVDQHVFNCEYLRKKLSRNIKKNNSRVIRNLPLTTLTDTNSEGTLGDFQISRKELSVIYVGQISEHKGIKILIRAFRERLRLNPSIKLSIIGSFQGQRNVQASQLKAELDLFLDEFRDQVKYHGHVTNVAKHYKEARILVVPSIWEDPSPNVVLEAKMFGVPTVAFNVGGISELVNHGYDGIICENISSDSLAEELISILENESRWVHMRNAALNDFAKRFGRERFQGEWASLLLNSEREGVE